ncbi:MAG TPA: GNAT family N-acetyltransferase [Candidatus Nanopelagicales bacterium]
MTRAEDRRPASTAAQRAVVLRSPAARDYPLVSAALSDWMPPERVARLLPRGSLTHCAETSVLAIDPTDDAVAGLLIALVDDEHPQVGYVHFVWVSPERRGTGLGRRLYRAALELLHARGCTVVEAVTGRDNRGAIAFHRRLGFDVANHDSAAAAGADLVPDEDAVLMTRRIDQGRDAPANATHDQ